MRLLLLCDLAGSRGSLKLSCLRAPEVATKFETLGRVHGTSFPFSHPAVLSTRPNFILALTSKYGLYASQFSSCQGGMLEVR